MYADFESILEPIQGPGNNPQISSTRGVNIHTPSGWCIQSEFAYGEVKDPLKLYRGKDCVSKFCNHIITEARCLCNSFQEKLMEPLTKGQLKEYNHKSRCHICFGPFRLGNRKVRDLCHYSGIYRGAAHSLCNLQYKIPTYIPVVFHNLAGYDAHMFIKELAKYGSRMGVIAKNTENYIFFSVNVEVIAKNTENYIFFSVNVDKYIKYIDKAREEKSKEISFRFVDSIKFMRSSLDSLVNNLVRGGGEFFGFEDYNESQYKLLIRKRIYQYK